MELAEIPMNKKLCEQFSEQIYEYLTGSIVTEQDLLADLQEQWVGVYQ